MKVRDIVMREDAKITKSDGSGVEITADDGVKTTLPAEKAAAIMPDPDKPGEYDFNPQAVTQPATGQPAGPKVGANVEIKTAETSSDMTAGMGTMSTSDFVKGAYSVAAEYGSEAPDPEEIKKQMVLTPNGEVDLAKTFAKIYATFQAAMPQIDQMLKDLGALLQNPESQAAPNPELARIQELSGMTDEDVSFNGVTQHDNGDMSYSQGPLSVRQNKDGSSDMQATIGDTTARVQQNPIGVKTMTAQGSAADAIVGTDASAQRKGVDPTKFAAFKQQAGVQESAELTAMLKIAGLR
jgi:hypothetical protein